MLLLPVVLLVLSLISTVHSQTLTAVMEEAAANSAEKLQAGTTALLPNAGHASPGEAHVAGQPLLLSIQPRTAEPRPRFEWANAVRQSFYLLSLEHGYRMFQAKTRRELAGPLFRDYFTSVRNISGWDDGDSKITNYFGHPMQGAVAGYIQVQNDPAGRNQEFGKSSEYWASRLRALAWSAAYSTQFEIGLYSEAMLGNVGLKKGQAGYVDLVMTPVGGFALMIAEDALDRLLANRFEPHATSGRKAALYRALLNPARSIANILRMKAPWYRDTRPVPQMK